MYLLGDGWICFAFQPFAERLLFCAETFGLGNLGDVDFGRLFAMVCDGSHRKVVEHDSTSDSVVDGVVKLDKSPHILSR